MLADHRAFYRVLGEAITAAQTARDDLCVLMIDINNFKLFNDAYGHPVGDRVLQTFADLLRRESRTTDHVARYGGDEFALLAPNTTLAAGRQLAQRLLEVSARAAIRVREHDNALPLTLSIGVASAPGQGSKFWFNIRAPTEEKIVAPTSPPSATWDVGPLDVLMVEDVAVNRELVSDMLSPFGIRVAGAADGIEAVEAALGARFDLILMDLQMPRLDGLAATQAIRANSDLNRDTPIVALSANVVQAQVDACHEAGMNDFIRKPIDLAELLAKIAHWTRGAEVAAETPSQRASEP